MQINQIQKETFNRLLEQVRTEVSLLKKTNRELERENEKLRQKLKKVHKTQSDIFSSINESERMAMRHHVNGLIQKIDKYLDES